MSSICVSFNAWLLCQHSLLPRNLFDRGLGRGVELLDNVVHALLEVLEDTAVRENLAVVGLDHILDRLPIAHHKVVDPGGHRLLEHVEHGLRILPRERHRGDY